MAHTDNNINIGIPLYVGYQITAHPKEDVTRLIPEFGLEKALQLEVIIKQLLNELNQLKPDWNLHTLVSASQWAGNEMKHKHPALEPRAIAALEWIFSWWWK